MTSDKPNVLFVFSDQQRASAIGCSYGDKDLMTPNFDALAGEGMQLETAVSNTPVCTPYRAMLMTGLYGHHTGVTTNNCYPDLSRHAHVGRTFADAGYRCGYIGKWHLGEEVRLDAGHPMRLGFNDEWFVPVVGRHNNPNRDHAINSRETEVGEGLDRTEAETNRAIEFINKQDGETPWCLFISWYPPHPPLESPAPYIKPYLDRDLRKHPTTWQLFHEDEIADLNGNYAHYYGLISQIDAEFGRMMRALTECGQAENTIVIFTSDHGEMLGSQGLYSKHWPLSRVVARSVFDSLARQDRGGLRLGDAFWYAGYLSDTMWTCGYRRTRGFGWCRLLSGIAGRGTYSGVCVSDDASWICAMARMAWASNRAVQLCSHRRWAVDPVRSEKRPV